MRILIRTSRWAIWARRLGAFAIALMIISTFFHRTKILESSTFTLIIAVGSLLAFLAVIFSITAMLRIWNTGDHGWSRSFVGLMSGGLALLPAAYTVYFGATTPMTNHVSTDWQNMPPLVSQAAQNLRLGEGEQGISAAFPNAVNRAYRVEMDTLFALVVDQMRLKEWRVEVERPASAFGSPAQLNAIATTLLGYEDEVGLLLAPKGELVEISMVSASQFGWADLGANGRRIENFLLELDAEIAALAIAALAIEEAEDAEAPAVRVEGLEPDELN